MPELQPLRILTFALCGSPIVIGVAISFVLGAEDDAFTVLPVVLLVQLVAALMVHGVVELVGYRLAPFDRRTTPADARAQLVRRLQPSVIVRFALCESVLIVSLAVAFIVEEGGFVVALTGIVLSEILFAVHVILWRRPLTKMVNALEAGGAYSGLREPLGLPMSGPGIQQL